ncbi:LOW QUALITY PROTEIN: hypothetical protein SETIT_9G099600v2 [Setaria italica]|uniref:Uncharacterized protein n=1 Tax=Setaria italica TaxID=4555 RepID=A0A368SEW9_SETIT|nr:LOW QUALITY PROTEIN: hypothetical protein SETIT_9G099600v2 [Setaria italica]
MTKLISHQGKTMLQSQIDRTEQPPPPAVVRLGAPRGAPSCFAAAFDTMIMAMHVEGPYDDDDDDDDRGGDTHLLPESLVPVFDVRSRPSGADPVHLIYISTGNRASTDSFELLDQAPLPEPDEPGGKCWAAGPAVRGTSSLTHRAPGWRHGDWILPFFGRGHFDPELNACVGISRYPDIRHICAGARRRRQGGNACPVGKENLFAEEPDEWPVGAATLVDMGGGSRFCPVQCVSRVTTLFLKYDKNGDLTTGYSRRIQNYRVPEEATESMLKYPVAFWM